MTDTSPLNPLGSGLIGDNSSLPPPPPPPPPPLPDQAIDPLILKAVEIYDDELSKGIFPDSGLSIDPDSSLLTATLIVLKSSSGRTLRIYKRAMLGEAHGMTTRASKTAIKNPDQYGLAVSKRSDKACAIAWARLRGYPIPSEPHPCMTVIAIIGLAFGVIPGVILLFFLASQSQNCKRDTARLIEKWIDAGRPIPAGAHAPPQQALPKALSAAKDQLSNKLEKIDILYENGNISEAEYIDLRNEVIRGELL